LLDHIIEDQAINWLQRVIPSEVTLPSRIETDDRWHYLNRNKTCGYRATRGQSRSGIPTLRVTFNNFKNGGYSEIFNSYETTREWLSTHRRVHHQSTTKKFKLAESQLARRKQQSVRYDTEQLWPSLSPIPNRSLEYYQEKGIPLEWLGNQVRFGNDADHPFIAPSEKRGDYAAVLIRSMINNQPLGIQRIYADGTKRFTWGLDKSQAPYIQISSFNRTQPVHFLEGLADGLILHQALNQPVIVALDANNLKAVVTQFHQRFPQRKGYIWADNDQWKYDRADNVGILKGMAAAQATGYQIVIPQFTDYDCSNRPTDLSDLFKLGGLQAIQDLYRSATKPLMGYEWCKKQLNYIGLRQINNTTSLKSFYSAIRKLCLAGLDQTPLQPLETITAEIIQVITDQSARIPLLPVEELLDYAQKFLQRKYEQQIQASVRQISQKLLEMIPPSQIKVFDLVPDAQGKLRIPPRIAREIVNKTKGLDIILAPKDTGKTHSIIKPAVKRAKRRLKFPVIITPLVTLTQLISKECGVVNYQDIINCNDATTCDSLGVTINSINKPRLQPILQYCNELYADEIDADLDAIATGTIDPFEKPEIYEQLLYMAQNTPRVVLTSADIDDLCIKQFLQLRPDVTIYIPRSYLPKHPTIQPLLAGKRVYLHHQQSDLLDDIVNFISKGGTAGFACDHVSKVHNLVKLAQSRGIKALEISKNTIKSPEVQAFLNYPNEEIKKYQLIAYTPSLGIGVSIDVPHLERIYGIYHRETTTSGFLQMLFRSRPTMEYHLAFPPRAPKERLTLAERQQLALIPAQQTYQLVGHQSLPFLSQFDTFRLESLAQQEREQDPNIILRRLIAEGAQLIYQTAPIPVTTLKSEFKALSEQEIALKIQSIIELASQLDRSSAKDYLDQHQEPALRDDNYLAAQLVYYFVTVNENLVAFWINEGYQKYLALEKSLAPQREALNLDLLESQHLHTTLLTHNRIKQIFNHFLLRTLQLVDDQGNFFDQPVEMTLSTDSPIAQLIVSQIWKHRQLFNGVQLGVKITAQTLPKPVQFLRNWLGTLGITLKMLPRSATGSRKYRIDYELIQQRLVPILQQRRLDGQSELKDKLKRCQKHINSRVSDNLSNLSIYNCPDVTLSMGDNSSNSSRYNCPDDVVPGCDNLSNEYQLNEKIAIEEELDHQLKTHSLVPFSQPTLEETRELTRSGGRRARRYGGGEEDGAQHLSFNSTQL